MRTRVPSHMRPRLADEFKRASREIKRGGTTVLNYVLDHNAVGNLCWNVVNTRMRGRSNRDWLQGQPGVNAAVITPDNIRIWLVRWLDALVKEFSA